VALDFGLLIMPTPRGANTVARMMEANDRWLRAAAEHGLAAWFVDHFQFGEQPYLECFAQLAHSAGRFPGLRVGTLVLGVGYRNPALVAKIGATLQLLTGGNLILGIGAGWKEDEYGAYGYPFPPARQRIDELDEAIRIIKALWTEPEVTFEGRYHRVAGAICEPRPVPPPVLMVGGGGEKRTLRVAAEHADWWNVDYVPPEVYARKVSILADHCRATGRDPATVTPTYFGIVSLSNDPDRVIRTPPPRYPPTAHVIAGGPEEVAERLPRFEQLGARHIQLAFLDYPETDGLELFLDEVLPGFMAAPAVSPAAVA
jgi:alkanesulfonate monooxygenase SsuD/methylene tetrahydromethanopterin reductase-like flavin-dependent oxidoreductase (luciferase family)